MKKSPKDYQKLEEEYFKTVEEKGLSKPLCNYVWNVLIAMSRGYGFNAAHTLAYSLLGLQEMNLAYKFPIIYWNCANLITDTGGIELNEEENKTTDYGKLATAIGKMRNMDIDISLPDINEAKYTFYPNEEENKIVFGLRGIVNVGDALINSIIENRPYKSIKDFYSRIRPNKQAMLALIKSGAFDNLIDRNKAMIWYIWETCDKKKRMTLQNINGLVKYQLFPEDKADCAEARSFYEFNRYLKACCKYNQTEYKLDTRAINFLISKELYSELVFIDNNTMNIKKWEKIYNKKMDILRDWIAANKDSLLSRLNYKIFKADYDNYAEGSLSKWEMEALGFYYHEHELINVDKMKYGIRDFNTLPNEPIVDKTFKKGDKQINLYKLNRIFGTCIAKDKNKATVSLLTTNGVVTVKFRKEYFAIFDKQISKRNPDGTKTIIEKSWFNKGNMIMVMGIRSEDNFIVKKYASSVGEQLYHIDKVNKDGTLVLRHERMAGEESEED